MAGQGAAISLAQEGGRPRKYGFALTPLADAMFQLLIFFMLSSSLSPYSLIALTRGAPAGQSAVLPGAADETAPTPEENARMVIWNLTRGQVRAGDQTVPLAELPGVIAALKQQEVEEVLIFPTRAATVQDIATVLEMLGARGISKVRLVSGSRVGG